MTIVKRYYKTLRRASNILIKGSVYTLERLLPTLIAVKSIHGVVGRDYFVSTLSMFHVLSRCGLYTHQYTSSTLKKQFILQNRPNPRLDTLHRAKFAALLLFEMVIVSRKFIKL